MLRLPSFGYASPETLEEAVRLMSRSADVLLVSGGTDIYPNMKRLQMEPSHLLSLRRVSELKGIRGDGRKGVVVGAGTTLAEIAGSPVVVEFYPALAEAAASVGSPQIRNAATLGGNLCQDTRCSFYDMPATWRKGAGVCLKQGGDSCTVAPGGERCWAVTTSDIAPVAIALGASLRLVSARGKRTVEVKSLYRDDGMAHLGKARDEIVAEMSVPAPRGLRAKYLKFRQRGTIDFPVIGAAVALRLNEDGICGLARVVLGAVGSNPLEVESAEEALVGSRVTEQTIAKASEAAFEACRPMDNMTLTVQYRKSMARVLVARALRSLAKSR